MSGPRTVPFERVAVIACRLTGGGVEITDVFRGGRDHEALHRRPEAEGT